MKTKFYTKLFMGLATVCLLATLAACDKDDKPELPDVEPVEPVQGCYILNTGNWGQNDASVLWYEADADATSADLYAEANGENLGDVAQDLIVYGSKVYIACNGSAKLVVVDKRDFKLLRNIPLLNEIGQPVNPNYLTAADGNVYFTSNDGTVTRLDTLSLDITGKLTLDGFPAALTSAAGKLYINMNDYNFDYTGKQIAVVNIASFNQPKYLDVVLNPYDVCLTGSDGNVYFISQGHSDGNPPHTLQRIDPATDEVTVLLEASKMAMHGDLIYYYYAEYGKPLEHISVYNIKTQTTTEFLSKAQLVDISAPLFIAVDPHSGDVYFGNFRYDSKDDLYIYAADGTFRRKVESGVYVTKVVFP
ncbi:MAG: hypothetical protein LBN06_03865 [Prevotellaceae bacterium]|jgi:outer membrane protein assembly factor BamB|nr:hypothetical protein [Prevotellaceae bacterium]